MEKVAVIPFGGNIIPHKVAEPGGPQYVKIPLNSQAWFTDASTKLKANGVCWILQSSTLSANYAGQKVDVVAWLSRQNSRLFSALTNS